MDDPSVLAGLSVPSLQHWPATTAAIGTCDSQEPAQAHGSQDLGESFHPDPGHPRDVSWRRTGIFGFRDGFA